MTQPIEPDELARLTDYLSGETSPAAAAATEAWLAEHPDQRALARQLQAAGESLRWPGPEPVIDAERVAQRAIDQIAARRERPASVAPRIVPSGPSRHTRWAIATASFAAAAIALFVWGRHEGTHADRDAASVHEFATARTQRTTLTLSDGSRVTLAPGSRLRVDAAFGGASRTVTLDGEALFHVSSKQGAPFIVQTGGVHTRVLGTEFMVRRYAADRTVTVAVTSGKVSVGGTQHVTLAAGDVGEATDSTAIVAHADASALTAWTRGELIFDNAPVSVVLQTLGRWYDYDFKLADSALARGRVSAVFQIDAAEETLLALKDVLDVTMTFQGKVVTLRARKRSASPAPSRPRVHDALPKTTEIGK